MHLFVLSSDSMRFGHNGVSDFSGIRRGIPCLSLSRIYYGPVA